jgi:hypothetical protein
MRRRLGSVTKASTPSGGSHQSHRLNDNGRSKSCQSWDDPGFLRRVSRLAARAPRGTPHASPRLGATQKIRQRFLLCARTATHCYSRR